MLNNNKRRITVNPPKETKNEMSPVNFVYWLQGFAELSQEPPTKEQWNSIKDHLNLVLDKKTSNTVQEESNTSIFNPSPFNSNPSSGLLC